MEIGEPLVIFNTPARQVTFKTRAKWSTEETDAFQNFALKLRDKFKISKLSPDTDISGLLEELHISKLYNICNYDNHRLGPILDVKVRRKLQNVWQTLPVARERTRLQTARAEAVSEGREPPEKLPAPKAIYEPAPWGIKSRTRARSGNPSSTTITIEQARMEVAKLTKALKSARLRLAKLEEAEIGGFEGDDQQNDEEEHEQEGSETENQQATTPTTPPIRTMARKRLPCQRVVKLPNLFDLSSESEETTTRVPKGGSCRNKAGSRRAEGWLREDEE